MSKKPDTGNAHVRQGSTRDKPEVIANDVQRFLDDPAFQRVQAVQREAMLRTLETFVHDGSAECDAQERELCRQIRTMYTYRTTMNKLVQGNQLREAGFKPAEQQG